MRHNIRIHRATPTTHAHAFPLLRPPPPPTLSVELARRRHRMAAAASPRAGPAHDAGACSPKLQVGLRTTQTRVDVRDGRRAATQWRLAQAFAILSGPRPARAAVAARRPGGVTRNRARVWPSGEPEPASDSESRPAGEPE